MLGQHIFSLFPSPSLAVILFDVMSRGCAIDEAWGKLLGTIMLCVWLEALISLIPNKVLKRICPPFVLGVTVTLIGVQLTGAGIKFWGGGVGCSRAPSADNVCLGNGDAQLGFGSPPCIGMGFSVFLTFLFVEVFGSPFMRNTMVIWCANMVGFDIEFGTVGLLQPQVHAAEISRGESIPAHHIAPFKMYGALMVPGIDLFHGGNRRTP